LAHERCWRARPDIHAMDIGHGYCRHSAARCARGQQHAAVLSAGKSVRGNSWTTLRRSNCPRHHSQCHVRLPPAVAGFISTLKVKVRCSSGRIAPTPTSLRAISSPRSLRMVSTMEYSHAPLSAGLRKLPSTRSGVDAGAAVAPVGSLKRSLWRQAGHTLALSRMVSRQCGQLRVAPAVPGFGLLTKWCRRV